MNALDQQAEDQEIDQLLALADERVAFPDGAESTVDKLRSELETIAVDLREPVSSEPFEAEPACLRAVEMAAALMQKPVSVLVSVPAQGQDRAPQVVDASLNGLGEIGPYKLLELLGQGL